MDGQMRRRLEISLRLKAARFLAGSHRVRPGSKSGKPEAIALPVKELANRSPLPENRISANKLVEIEEMKTHVTPSQVALIGQALGVDLDRLPLLNPGWGNGAVAGADVVLPDDPEHPARDDRRKSSA